MVGQASAAPTGLAIALAAIGACCYAVGARTQNRAVFSGSGQRLRPGQLLRLLRNRRWLAGFAVSGVGTGLHLLGLSLASLTVIQPIGMLALPLTAVLDAATRRTHLTRASLAAVAACIGGVGLFVVLAATATDAAAMPVTPAEMTHVITVLGGVVLALWILTMAAPWRLRGLLQALAAGTCFGCAAVLVKVLMSHLGSGSPSSVPVLAVACLLVALQGGWHVQQSHASAPTEVVVAGLIVVDPLVASGIGISVLGEAAGTPPIIALALVGCAACAVGGVIGLARRHAGASEPPPAPRRRSTAGALRILLAADTFPPDVNGAARFTQRLAAGLAQRGHEVHVVCPAPRPSWRPEATGAGVTTHRLVSHPVGVHPTFRVCLPWRIARPVAELIDTVAPDVVHVQSHFVVGRSAVAAANRRGVPVIATNHFMPENLLAYAKIPRWLHGAAARMAWRDLHRVYAGAATVTAPTPRAAALLADTGFPRPVLAISCGIDPAPYQWSTAGRPAGGPVVLFVGRLDAEKHVDELLTAMTLLPDRLAARLEIVGDGRQRARLEALTDRLGLRSRVVFHGLVPEPVLLGAYARCTVFCMPGIAELQSLATMEAMAAGKPVVAADAMALPHLVRDAVNGWLYPPGNPAALAERLTRVLAQPDSARAAMGAASRDIIAGHGITATLAAFEGVYHATSDPTAARAVPA